MNITTVAQVKKGAELPAPLYVSKPYVVLGIRGNSKGIVLTAGTLGEIKALTFGGYYDECVVEVRTHDLYMSDNTRIPAEELDHKLVSKNFSDFIGKNKKDHLISFEYLSVTDNANEESKIAFAAVLALASD